MLDTIKNLKRTADLVMLNADATGEPLTRRLVRAQNFAIDWFKAEQGATLGFASGEETMVLLFDASGIIGGGGHSAVAPGRSVSVVPAGRYELELRRAGCGCILSTNRTDPQLALNAASYQTPDPRVAPIGPAWPRHNGADDIRVFEIDKFRAPADNPRLKMLQSATMSVNWVDYDGPRDRKALSPHAHADFEQASLAVAGDFVHHLRVAWGKNAEEWRDDEHKLAPSPSVLVIPPELIHTTEGVGPGHHLLIDVFAPPRRDFIAKGWVFNAAVSRPKGSLAMRVAYHGRGRFYPPPCGEGRRAAPGWGSKFGGTQSQPHTYPHPASRRFAWRATLPTRGRVSTRLLASVMLLSAIIQAPAQPWPSRAVTIVVPFPAGGSTDIVARLMAEQMRTQFSGAFVIENKPGATGNLAVVQVAKSAPDGYTLLFSTSAPVATNVLIFKHPPVDPLKELTPIALIAEVPLLVAVNAKLPIHNIAELLAYDKANPGKLNFGHAGTGGMGHMASELLASMEGRTFNSIPYQGSAPVTKDLMAGMVDVAFDFVPSYIPQIKAGTIRAIAVTTAQRLPDLPDVPTIAEQGIANYEASSFVALLGPAGLPPDLVAKLNAAVNDWLKTEAAKQALAQQTLRPLGGTPETLRNRIQSEIEKWGPVVKRTGISLGN